MTDEIVVERVGARATVVLNRPERKNALTGPMATALAEAIDALAVDDEIRAVVLRGAGGAFCSGLDMKEFNVDPRPDWIPDFPRRWRAVQIALFDFPKPIVGALERFAINGGGPLALGCDHLIAGEGAYLQVGEIQQGVSAAMNIGWLRLRHSEAVAARVALTGDRIGAADLFRLGIATHVVPDDEVVAKATELADRIASYPPAGSRKMKVAIRGLSGVGDAASWFDAALSADPAQVGMRLTAAAE